MQLTLVTDPDVPGEKIQMYIYDTEYEEALTIDTSFKIFKDIKGLSQLNINNNLYLCGTPNSYENAGSYLIRYDVCTTTSNSFLVNSIFPHYKPAMAGVKNEFIIIIGGEKTKKCEFFNLKTNKWKTLPELPEERTGCCAIYDEFREAVYVLGGYNSAERRSMETVLYLNFRTNLAWETLEVKGDLKLLARSSSAVIKFDKRSVYILGGIDDNGQMLDSIVEYDLVSNEVELSKRRLNRAASFSLQTGVDLNKADYSFFDNENYVHRISKTEFKVNLIHFSEVAQTEGGEL